MADTGAPYFIPYVEPTDLVRDYPAADEASADAIAAALDAAGGLVAVKSAIFTATQAASVTAGANVAVTNLSITHAVADPANRLIISMSLGLMVNSIPNSNVGLGLAIDGTLVAVGDADGARTQVTHGGYVSSNDASFSTNGAGALSTTIVVTPGAGEKTYTVRAINVTNDTTTIRVNRAAADTNNEFSARAVSSLVIQEVKV